ncbi:MAG TPA: pitrilysin family protein [Polyangiaceae bacterium]|jgi:predicted Zn-dependent peptidase|nr:pitrilysin family protein [Polyangiaceae bacterium]
MAHASRLRARILIALALPCALAAPTSFAAPAGSTSNVENLSLSVQRVTLENGLRVVMNVDHTSPNIAVCVTYDVGSRNEEQGKSGFAHLFEHIMFQGSAHVAKGEHFKLITARGGTLNGTTSTDRTNYFEMLPSSELALALFLEGDRMKSLAVNPANVENQRAVVEEEYRMRVSNQAYAEGFVRLRALAYEGYFPYEHDTIGSMADLDAAKFEYVAAFHDQYYGPDNAVLTIAGDFDPDEAMRLVRENFGNAVRRKTAPAFAPSAVPEQKTERKTEITDTNAKNPGLLEAWVVPPSRTPEHYALELASTILGGGESSRLYQRLVRGDAQAQSVSIGTDDQRGPDFVMLKAVQSERGKLATVSQVVDAEIAKLAAQGPTPAEVDKAKSQVISQFVFGLESNLHRATELGQFEVFWGDARLLSREVEQYKLVTPAQVKDAVAKYLVRNRRSTVTVLPPPKTAAAAPQGKAK